MDFTNIKFKNETYYCSDETARSEIKTLDGDLTSLKTTVAEQNIDITYLDTSKTIEITKGE